MIDEILVVGNGNFGRTINENLVRISCLKNCEKLAVTKWEDLDYKNIDLDSCGIVHAGSGRQLPEVIDFCAKHGLPMIQASTDIDEDVLPENPEFVLIEAPNLAIPIVKFLTLLEQGNVLFRDYKIRIYESHQQTKSQLAGTAQAMAKILGVDRTNILMIRDQKIQQMLLHVPEEALNGHAIHQIEIEGHGATIGFSTKVFGRDAYLHGILAVFNVVDNLEQGRYLVTELVNKGLL